jgi:hypothetical protein
MPVDAHVCIRAMCAMCAKWKAPGAGGLVDDDPPTSWNATSWDLRGSSCRSQQVGRSVVTVRGLTSGGQRVREGRAVHRCVVEQCDALVLGRYAIRDEDKPVRCRQCSQGCYAEKQCCLRDATPHPTQALTDAVTSISRCKIMYVQSCFKLVGVQHGKFKWRCEVRCTTACGPLWLRSVVVMLYAST